MCRSDLNDGFSWSERTSRVGNVGGYGCKMRGSVPARRSGLDAEKKRGGDRARMVMIAAVVMVRVVASVW